MIVDQESLNRKLDGIADHLSGLILDLISEVDDLHAAVRSLEDRLDDAKEDEESCPPPARE